MDTTYLTELPNIDKTLAEKLNLLGISNANELREMGSENAIFKILTSENSGACKHTLCS